jgi:hypothetical protein
MRKLLLVLVALGLGGCSLLFGGDTQDDCARGHKLMLHRLGVDSFRACFAMDGDCDLIAGAMGEKEPAVRWFCK